jgi:transposase
MKEIITVGLDIAKSVFQVHGVDAAGEVVVRRQLKRRQVLQFFATLKPCVVGIEACATAHHWARELMKLGHDVRLMPPRYVKPYVKRNKNDAADAEAICEAVTRPTMRFVPVKTVEQQSVLILHRTRQLFIRQRTTLINSIRAHLAEFGIVAGIGRNGVEVLVELIAKGDEDIAPAEARVSLLALAAQLELVKRQILEMDRRVLAGIAAAASAATSKRSPASARSSQLHWSRVSLTRRSSALAATSVPGLVWYRSRTQAAVRRSWAASAKLGTATSGNCSSSALSP